MKEKTKRDIGPWILPPPWLPPEWELADASAIQALAAGTASTIQQQRALKWIIEKCAGTYDVGWHPEGDHLASFSAGRRFTGMQIVKLVNVNVALFRQKQERKDG